MQNFGEHRNGNWKKLCNDLTIPHMERIEMHKRGIEFINEKLCKHGIQTHKAISKKHDFIDFFHALSKQVPYKKSGYTRIRISGVCCTHISNKRIVIAKCIIKSNV